jgi:hypothetical protein
MAIGIQEQKMTLINLYANKSWWEGQYIYMGDIRHTEVQSGNLKARGTSGDPGADATIIFKWIISEVCMNVWTASVWLMLEPTGGLLWTRSTKDVEFLHQLSDNQLFKLDSYLVRPLVSSARHHVTSNIKLSVIDLTCHLISFPFVLHSFLLNVSITYAGPPVSIKMNS